MAVTTTWVENVADLVEERVRGTQGAGSKIVCASGISPSGPIHLGNLRELITVHLVTEELKLRGWNAEHIHSWDDFDRFRKVPVYVPPEFSVHLGKPLVDVPDPAGEFPNYAERFKQEFSDAVAEMGIFPRFITQSVAYRRGDYVPQMIHAMEKRFEIFDMLAEHQTLERHEKTVEQRREAYYPIRVYCEACGKDETEILGWQPDSATIAYHCFSCQHRASFSLYERVPCKLVWKVDWPMRWAYEQVNFEPAGEDHGAPGSSYTVGSEIVRDIYGFLAPVFFAYSFVGMAGRTKMSSSVGISATPRSALDIMEPPIVRWLYLRRQPNQKFNIDFGQEVIRLYDEWDSFAARVSRGQGRDTDPKIYDLCVRTSAGAVKRSELPVSFRMLASSADITQGNAEQMMRIAADALKLPPETPDLAEKLEPRLSCARRWATQYLPDDERTTIRAEFDAGVYAGLDAQAKAGLRLLLEKLEDDWSLDGLTALVYGIPKLLLGLPMDAKPTDELKQAQRNFFIAIYALVCGSDTGPRLPTLFLSLGAEKVRQLLGG